MFSSISSINSISTKAKKLVGPTPNTYFNFNSARTSGTTVTAEISGSTIILSNSLATIKTGQKEGTACFFGGNKLYYGISSNTSLSATNGISVSFWFKSNSTGSGAGYLFSLGAGTVPPEVILVQSNANGSIITVTVTGLTVSTGTATTTITPTLTKFGEGTLFDLNWHHLVLTWNNNILKGYINNYLRLDNTTAPTLRNTNVYTKFGVNVRHDGPSTGNMTICNFDCLRLYDRELSETEINEIYNAGT